MKQYKVLGLLGLWMISVIFVAASPALDVRLSEQEITVSGSPVTIEVTYENVGDSALSLYLFVYDDGSNPGSPRPVLVYKGEKYTTSIGTGVIFGTMELAIGELKTIDITFEGFNVNSGEYSLHIGGYQERVDDSYIGYDDAGLMLQVVGLELSKPELVYPVNNAEVAVIPVLEWVAVPKAQGYTWEISDSTETDENNRFVNPVCSGTTEELSVMISCALQEGIWYWHVWAFAENMQGPVSDINQFTLLEMNHAPQVQGVVAPESGTPDMVYTYSAVYTDTDNDPPAVVTIYIDDTPFTMVQVYPDDTNYTDGAQYQYSTTLGEGVHSFYVYCEDIKGGSTRYPESGSIEGPVVTTESVSLSKPELKTPVNNAEVPNVPVLEWVAVPKAQGYTWEISDSTETDENNRFVNPVCSGTTEELSVLISCALQEGIWYWHVWSFAENSQGPVSDTYKFKIITSLTSPVLTNPPVGAINVELRPVFSWEAVPNATYYTLQVSTDSSFTYTIIDETVNATSFVPAVTLTEATEYYWRVQAGYNSKTSEWVQGHFTTASDFSLNPPTLVYPEDSASNIELRPVFSWDPVERAAVYVLQVSTSSSFAHFTINEKVSATSYMTSFDLESDMVYYWKVRAENENGPSNWSDITQFETVHIEEPKIPTPIVATPDGEKGEGTIDLSWNAVPDAEIYHVQVSKNNAFPLTALEKINSKATAKTTSTSLEVDIPPGQYYWRVRAENENGYSAWSKGDHYFVIVRSSQLQTIVFNPIVQGIVVISAVLTIIYVLIPIIRKK
ncbi:MAG: fibronectin type III domain-containing protein [Candidatus Methanofastidiosia archaeon]|jgi:hypothetical protein